MLRDHWIRLPTWLGPSLQTEWIKYCKALSDEDLTKFMKKAKNKFPSVDFSHGDWFFGSKEKGIPRWTGYSLGFKLVSDYLKMNPDKKTSELYSTKAEEFLPIL